MSKRSTRLNSHELSAKAITEKKLRSRKVTIVDESSRKTNFSIRSKRLCKIGENISAIKNVSHKIYKNICQDEEKMNVEKSDKKEKKTNKMKNIEKTNEEKKKTSKKKEINSSNMTKTRSKKFVKKEEMNNNPTGMRQMSLKESFAHQVSPRRLRSRGTKNYCEDSKLLQHLPLQKRASVVLLEKIDLTDTKKVPVYKTIKASEIFSEDKNDIYDFKYDANDTKEKLLKKKKKKKRIINKTRGKMIKKSAHKKVTTQSKEIDNETNKSDTKIPIKIQNDLSLKSVTPLLFAESMKDVLEKIEIPGTDIETQMVVKATSSDLTVADEIKKQDRKKPKIISVEDVDDITRLSINNFKNFHPFRPTKIFSNKSAAKQINDNTTLSCTLLTKSLSPISKISDTFDAGSPWRPPILPMFSRAKHFVQSTPNVIKIDITKKKHIPHAKDDSCSDNKITNISDVTLKNTNSLILNISNKTNHNKNSNRKFGTVLTNIEHFNNSSMAQINNVEVINEKSISEINIKPISNIQSDTTVIVSPNYTSFDDMDNKENATPNYQTSKKPVKKKIYKQCLSDSPSKIYEMKTNIYKENMDSQPGPSNMKNLENSNEPKLLHQSNLNNFLNLMDMPENTRISTKHGIFDDAHSTSISSNAIKKINKPTMDLENAFGFCEKEPDISSIENELTTKQPSNKIQMCTSKSIVQPARLLVKELKNQLQKKPDNNTITKQRSDQKDIEVSKPSVTQKSKQLMDVLNFSDTFDILSETERLSNCGTDISLFMDTEPIHFSKPPQHSYKRKRIVTFDFSKDNETEERDNGQIRTKKRKLAKLQKEHKKRLDEWVKTVNDTFQEIDEYDLLIE